MTPPPVRGVAESQSPSDTRSGDEFGMSMVSCVCASLKVCDGASVKASCILAEILFGEVLGEHVRRVSEARDLDHVHDAALHKLL